MKALLATAGLLLGLAQAVQAAAPETVDGDGIHLELSPRICTLANRDKQCQTAVHAQWSAPREESLCLVIVDRPDIKHCWEHYSQGTYSIDLTFVDDLTFQLRDIDGLSIRETARILGVPTGTVKAQSTRARKKLKELMQRTLRPRSGRLPNRFLHFANSAADTGALA